MRIGETLLIFLAATGVVATLDNVGKGALEKKMVACKFAAKTENNPTVTIDADFAVLCADQVFLQRFAKCMQTQGKQLGDNALSKTRKILADTCGRNVDKELLTHNYPPSPGDDITQAFVAAYETYDSKCFNDTYRFYFAIAMLTYWLAVVALGSVRNFLYHFTPGRGLKLKTTVSNNIIVRKLRQYITIPAIHGKHAVRTKLGGVIPTRLEVLPISVFLLLTVIGMSIKHRTTPLHLELPDLHNQQLYLVAHRGSTVAVFLIPIMFLFGTRNNFMLWLTGWKQATFLTFHKWIARVIIVLAITHGGCIMTILKHEGIFEIYIKVPFIKYGLSAFVLVFCLLFQTFALLRKHFYEVFFVIHVSLAASFIAVLWHHTEATGVSPCCYTAVALWLFDLSFRILRISAFGIQQATIGVVSDEVIQVIVPKRTWWRSFNGAYAYIYFMHPLIFWQSHPFTIVDDDKGNLCFCVKIKSGATRKLYQRLLKCPNQRMEIKIALEGPYGDRKPLETYENVLMYTGGDGIVGPYMYTKGLASNDENCKNFVKLYWVIRHWHSIDWFYDELQYLRGYSNIKVVVYVTRYHESVVGVKHLRRPSGATSEVEFSVSGDKQVNDAHVIDAIKDICEAFPHIEFKKGKPDVKSLVEEDLKNSYSNTAVMTCANPHMCDEIRSVVAQAASDHKIPRIDLFDELQVW